jgi:hypothetical protein
LKELWHLVAWQPKVQMSKTVIYLPLRIHYLYWSYSETAVAVLWLQHWITSARTNHCTERFHLPCTCSCLNNDIRNFVLVNWQGLQLQTQSLIPTDKREVKTTWCSKKFIFSEFLVLSVLVELGVWIIHPKFLWWIQFIWLCPFQNVVTLYRMKYLPC